MNYEHIPKQKQTPLKSPVETKTQQKKKENKPNSNQNK